MSKYRNDPRVCQTNDGYAVKLDGVTYSVVDDAVAGCIITLPGRTRGEVRIVGSGYRDVDEALSWLLPPAARRR